MTVSNSSPDSAVSPLVAMRRALAQKRFFKLIGGGSLTEAAKLTEICRAYALAGADCLDLAPEPTVLAAVDAMLDELPQPHPVVMVSIPLDPDPHFRKIDLDEPACTRCGLCLPACPTEALTLPDALTISQALCYGCGRCVPICPTEALALHPFQVESKLHTVLSHPRTAAVEIHSRYGDPYMLEAFFDRWEALLANKLIALCFRPTEIAPAQWLAFYAVARRRASGPMILQIDGAPMSGTDAPTASLPALQAARHAYEILQAADLPMPVITVSGGINAHTADYLAESSEYAFVAGVGMGTVARQAIWHLNAQDAQKTAERMISRFQAGSQARHTLY